MNLHAPSLQRGSAPPDAGAIASRRDRPGSSTHAVLVCWGSFMARSNGSHARVKSLLDFLCARFDKVTLYSYEDHPAEPWDDAQRAAFARQYPDVELVLDRQTPRLALARKAKDLLITLRPERAASILSHALGGQAPGLARLKQDSSAVFVVNYVDGLSKLNGVPAGRTIVETHDLKFLKRAKMSRTSPLSLAGLTRLRNEMASLSSVAALVAITPAEAAFFRAMLGDKRVFYVPLYDAIATPGAGPPAHSGSPDAGECQYDMLFAASENPLNVRGILQFLDHNADWLDRYSIALCGKICQVPEVRELAGRHRNLSLLGFVDDLPALYRRSRICLSPTDGTGLKIKLVEALRHGRPVLASAHSMEGLPPGAQDCVFPIERTVAQRLLEDAAALDGASKAARQFYEHLSDTDELDALAGFASSLSRREEEIVS